MESKRHMFPSWLPCTGFQPLGRWGVKQKLINLHERNCVTFGTTTRGLGSPVSSWNVVASFKGWKLRKHEERAFLLWCGPHLTAQLSSEAIPNSLWAADMDLWESVQKNRRVLRDNEAAVLAVGAQEVFTGNSLEDQSDVRGRATAGTLALFLGR